MIEHEGGPHHSRCHEGRVGKQGERISPQSDGTWGKFAPPDYAGEPFVEAGTRFLHPISDDHLTAAIYVAQDGKLIYEGERRFTKPYPTVVGPRLWGRLRLE